MNSMPGGFVDDILTYRLHSFEVTVVRMLLRICHNGCKTIPRLLKATPQINSVIITVKSGRTKSTMVYHRKLKREVSGNDWIQDQFHPSP
jgi:hypothetical protein